MTLFSDSECVIFMILKLFTYSNYFYWSSHMPYQIMQAFRGLRRGFNQFSPSSVESNCVLCSFALKSDVR